jgi:hypothetical protein
MQALTGGYSLGMGVGGMGAHAHAAPSMGQIMEELAAAEHLRRQHLRAGGDHAGLNGYNLDAGLNGYGDAGGYGGGGDGGASAAMAAAVAAAAGQMLPGGGGYGMMDAYQPPVGSDGYSLGMVGGGGMAMAYGGGLDGYGGLGGLGGLGQQLAAPKLESMPEPAAPAPHHPIAPRGGSHGGGLRTKAPRGGGGDGGEAHSFRGVFWDKKSRRWRCQLGHKNKKIFLGYFNDAAEAARAYDAKLVELNGANGAPRRLYFDCWALQQSVGP